MPTNLYGPNDNFDPETSHVLPALIGRFHNAKIQSSPNVTIWGTGKPRREFMYVDDLADALVFLMNNYNKSELINIGIGDDVEILEIAKTIARVVGYKGEIKTDPTKPDGTPRKLVDTTKLSKLGWYPKTSLENGLKKTYAWFLENCVQVK